jgi:hypothetical protein
MSTLALIGLGALIGIALVVGFIVFIHISGAWGPRF